MNAAELLKKYEPTPTKHVEYERQLCQGRFTACGKFFIACGYDATIQRWDITGDEAKLLSPLKGHHGWAQEMIVHPTSGNVISADSWGRIICRPYADATPKERWNHEQAHDGFVRSLALSPDGKTVASVGNDLLVKFWDEATGKLLDTLPGHTTRVFCLTYAPDGKSIVTGDLFGVVRQWDLKSKKVVREIDASSTYALNRLQDSGGVRRVTIDPTGKYLLCLGQSGPKGGFAQGTPALLAFDWKTGKLIRELKVGSSQDGFPYDAQFHPEGFVMATSCAFPGKGHVWFWNPAEEKPFYTSKKLPNGRSISLHPDGKRLALTISVSANRNGRPEGEYEGGSGKIQFLEFPA